MRYWRVNCPEQAPETVTRVSQFHAKNPMLPFADDTLVKKQCATEEIRQAAVRWLDPVYQQLEVQRLAQSDDSALAG